MVRTLSKGLGALILLASCGGSESSPAPPVPPAAPAATEPAPPAAPLVPAEPPTPSPTPVPEVEAAPSGDLRGDAARGADLYALYCMTCHGERGRGDGPAAAAMNPKPADHSDPARMGALSDAHLYKVIQKGGAAVGKSPLMAPWGSILNDSQIRDLIGFLRQLSST